MENGVKVWMDGNILNESEASVPIMTYGLHYGISIFEGIRAYDTRNGKAIFRLNDHVDRFFNSAKVMRLNIPYMKQELGTAIKTIVNLNPSDHDYIRPLAFLGESGGFSIEPKDVPTRVAIMSIHMGTYMMNDRPVKGVSMITSSWDRPSSGATSLLAKIGGNYVNSFMAKWDALNAGADEAILMNNNGTVAEGTGENIFFIRNGELMTPSLDSNVLEGITRDTVIRLAREMGHRASERRITKGEMYIADEAFLTGTAAEILPIREIDGITIGSGQRGPITEALQEAYAAIVSGRDPGHIQWLETTRAALPLVKS